VGAKRAYVLYPSMRLGCVFLLFAAVYGGLGVAVLRLTLSRFRRAA
jgi:hypothetical protein